MKGMSLATVVALVVVLALPSVPVGAEEDFDVEKAFGAAKTAADHEAIAAHYDEEAIAAGEKAAKHRKMAASYKKKGGPEIAKWQLDLHCERLAESYEKAAAESAALALMHRQLGKGSATAK